MHLILSFVGALLLGSGITLSLSSAPRQIVDPLCNCNGPFPTPGFPQQWPLPALPTVTGGATLTWSCFQVSGTTNCRITGTISHTVAASPQAGMSGFWHPSGLITDPPTSGPGAWMYQNISWSLGPNTDTWGPCSTSAPNTNTVWINIIYGSPSNQHGAYNDWTCVPG